jgi:molybdenum cofactor cytidylyltransferase
MGKKIGAVVLAAGMSSRMGQLKVLMEWEKGETILDHILGQLKLASVEQILVVTGNRADDVKKIAERHSAIAVFNSNYADGEMLSSLKVGLEAMPDDVEAVMVVLGDQPTMQAQTIKLVMDAYTNSDVRIVAPSYNMRRGHPMVIDRQFWGEIESLPASGAPRDVINAHAESIGYVIVDNDSILRDIDTPEQYTEERRRAGLADL